MLTADGLSVSLAESADSNGVYNRVKIAPEHDTNGQTVSVNMRLKIKNDFKNYQGREAAIAHLKDKFVSYSDKLRTGNLSADDVMRAAFDTDTMAEYLQTVYSNAGYEIDLFDGNYFALCDSAGNKYVIQYLPGDSVTPKAQMPVLIEYDEETQALGQIEFTFDENGIGRATSFIPGKHKTDTADGAIPLSDPIFDGATVSVILNAESKSSWELSHYAISQPIALTNDASRGLTLQASPVDVLPDVIGYEVEYYITDVYGSDVLLDVNDSTPMLRNIAHATLTASGLVYDGQPLREGIDYEKYTAEDGVFFFGIGSYTGNLSAQPSFEEKEVHVYRESMDENETVSVRFYEDKPHIPYVGFKQYYDSFMLGDLKVSHNGSSYTLTSDGGQTATLDAANGTLATDDFNGFITLPKLVSGGGSSLAYGLMPYLSFTGEEIVREGSPVTVDFGKYGIEAYGEADDVYLPLSTLSDLFETGKNYRVEYNGKNLYVVDGNRTVYASSAKDEDEEYYAPLMTAEKRPADLIEFTYNELCFSVDNFYGFPGSARLNDAVAEYGLDKAPENYEPTIKELLCSEDPAAHIVGLHLLFDGALDDKGHTEFTDWINIVLTDNDFARTVSELADQYELKTTEASEAHNKAAKEVPPFKESAYGKESYIVRGDTAVFTFDVLRADRSGWTRYYTDGTPPSEKDTYYSFRCALEKAQNDPAVKNFVIDLSTNGGGESDAAMAIMALVTGESYIRSENTLTGGVSVVHYAVDRNLDGVFDEKDSAVSYDLNFAVVTSLKTYSSANMLASLLHENGIPILGEQSCGGACSVITKPTPEGWEYSHSSYTRLADTDLQNIDGGVPVDVLLVTKDAAGTKDYSGLYDIDRLSGTINTYYGGMKIGDVNLDGSITIDDATLIQRAAVELEAFSDLQKQLADANSDGRVSILDVTCVQKYLAEHTTGTGRTGEPFTK